MRLDNILFRAGFTATIPEARQFINHGHILVNNHKINIPSYACQNQDKITLTSKKLIKDNIQRRQIQLPSHLVVNFSELQINILNNFRYSETGLKINELLIIEYYSRS